MRRLIRVVSCVVLALAVWPARADGPRKRATDPSDIREARRRKQMAKSAYDLFDYDRALKIFKASYDIDPDPDLLFSLGVTSYRQTLYRDAVGYLEQFLAQVLEDRDRRARAHTLIAECLRFIKPTVEVSSYPQGAAVYLDRRAPGDRVTCRTPCSVEAETGDYSITIELEGYQVATASVHAHVEKIERVDLTLVRLGAVLVSANVFGASVTFDTAGEAQMTPVRRQLPPGAHRLVVSKDGYAAQAHAFSLSPGQEIPVDVQLQPLPRFTSLDVRGQPGAEVRLDGVVLGKVPLERRVTAGARRVRVAAAEHRPFEQTLDLQPSARAELDVKLGSERTSRARWTIAGLAGFGGATLLSGAVVGILATTAESDYRALPTQKGLDRVQHRALAADILFVTGGVSLVGAAAVWFLSRDSEPVWDLSITPGGSPGAAASYRRHF